MEPVESLEHGELEPEFGDLEVEPDVPAGEVDQGVQLDDIVMLGVPCVVREHEAPVWCQPHVGLNQLAAARDRSHERRHRVVR